MIRNEFYWSLAEFAYLRVDICSVLRISSYILINRQVQRIFGHAINSPGSLRWQKYGNRLSIGWWAFYRKSYGRFKRIEVVRKDGF